MDVGISEYRTAQLCVDGGDAEGRTLSAVVKHRMSDFLVHELPTFASQNHTARRSSGEGEECLARDEAAIGCQTSFVAERCAH